MLTEMTILVLAVTNLILVRAVCNLLKTQETQVTPRRREGESFTLLKSSSF